MRPSEQSSHIKCYSVKFSGLFASSLFLAKVSFRTLLSPPEMCSCSTKSFYIQSFNFTNFSSEAIVSANINESGMLACSRASLSVAQVIFFTPCLLEKVSRGLLCFQNSLNESEKSSHTAVVVCFYSDTVLLLLICMQVQYKSLAKLNFLKSSRKANGF